MYFMYYMYYMYFMRARVCVLYCVVVDEACAAHMQNAP